METKPSSENTRRSGFEPLRPLFKKWEMLSKNLKKFPTKAPILLPDLFVTAEPGTDMHTVVTQLFEFLHAHPNLMSFYGDVAYLETALHYCQPNSGFPELIRLMEAVKSAAGFRNHYKGIVHINIDEWAGHQDDVYFSEFLTYLSENSGNWMIVLSTTANPKKKTELDELRSVCSMFLRIETAAVKLPNAEFYLDMLEYMLAGYGVYPTEQARKTLLGSIKVIRKNKYFCGSYNVGCFADDIVYTLYSRAAAPKSDLDEADIEEFGPESEYIKRTIVRMEKKNSIGFGN